VSLFVFFSVRVVVENAEIGSHQLAAVVHWMLLLRQLTEKSDIRARMKRYPTDHSLFKWESFLLVSVAMQCNVVC
jgi:hypothetical protein